MRAADLPFPKDLVAAWEHFGIDSLTDVQAMAFTHEPLVSGRRNAVVVAPTSSGKTFIGEALGAVRATRLDRVVYLVPFKALAEEKYRALSDMYGQFGMSVVVSSADRAEFDVDIRRGHFSIAVLVYEKFAHLVLAYPGLLQNIGLLVVDEIQMLRELHRGPRLELLLTKLLLAPQRPQLLALSATAETLSGLDEWLEADVIKSTKRPVPLLEGVCDAGGRFEYIDTDSGARGVESLGFPRAATNAEDLLAKLVEHHCRAGEHVLVFRSTKNKTEETAASLKRHFNPTALHPDTSQQLSLLDETEVRAYLEDGLCRGVAYHNADLSADERALVEREFREKRISVLVSTTTLAAGVNTPADVVIIPDVTRWSPETGEVFIPVSEYKNMAGRAGRLGIKTGGRSILLAAPGGYAKGALFNRYISGDVEPIESAIPQERDFSLHILNLVASGLARTEEEVVRVLERSFAFFSFYRHHGGLRDTPTQAVRRLVGLELLSDENGKIVATEMGKVVAGSGVSTEAYEAIAAHLSSVDADAVAFLELLYDVCSLPEAARQRPFLMRDEKLTTKFLGNLPGDLARGTRLHALAAAGRIPGERENAALKKVLLLHHWRGGKSARELGRAFHVGLGPIRDLGETVAWLLETLAACAKVRGFPDAFRQEVLILADELHFGVPREAVGFSKLHARGVSRDQILRLVRNERGVVFDSYDQVLDTPAEDFKGIVGPTVVERLKESILHRSGEAVRRTLQGHLARLERVRASSIALQAAYTESGTALERALEGLLNERQLGLGAVRIGRQNRGEADIHVQHPDGLIVASVTASEDGRKPIPWDKTREVLGSAAGHNPVSYVVIGRPDFHQLAREHAEAMRATAGERPLLLLPLPVLMECYVLAIESRVSGERVRELLRNERGYYTMDRLADALGLPS